MRESYRANRGLRVAFIIVFIVAAVGVSQPAWALRGGDQATWKTTTNKGPDAEAGGWWINLGITGARAKIDEKQPKALEVTYIFANTPAAGKLKVGDLIGGANGKLFTTAHKFGYGMGKFGYEGPMMDFGNALEESQGPKAKGKLVLDVLRDGKRVEVELNIATRYGQFSKTYPYNCKKSDLIFNELCQYLVDRQGSNGLWSGRPHINAFATLALMGSGNARAMPLVKRAVQEMARQTNADATRRGGLPAWKYGLYGMTLAEYYILTGEKWVLPELKQIDDWLRLAQSPRGGWGHAPWVDGGKNGYGPINIITEQAFMAWCLMARAGMDIDEKRAAAAHAFTQKGINNIGYVWYKDGGATRGGYADMGRTGAAALENYLCPFPLPLAKKDATLCARCIAMNPKTFPDTHGSPILGMGWTALGAATYPQGFRHFMDYNKWAFTLAHCPDGTFYYQPNRDNNKQDFAAAPRLSASAATALILSLKNKKLQITGAPLVDRRATRK